MTREHIDNLLRMPYSLLKAYANGKQIQLLIDGEWCDTSHELNFDEAPDHYRIKPEPPKPVERWTYEYRETWNGTIRISARNFFSKLDAESQGHRVRGERFIRAIRLVEATV